MQVFLIRHAEAIDETLAIRDPHRHLTARGRDQARALGDRLRWHDCLPTHILASPLVRAVQTAELVAANIHTTCTVDVAPELAPDGSAKALVAAIAKLPPTAVVVLVGHEPGLSAIGALVTGEPELAPLAKAEAARIVDGKLKWRFAHDAEAPRLPA